jgi:xanthine dehydrogenase YagR molybdenum-binding subunit
VRRGAVEKVTGRATYTFDVELAGMLHGVVVRSRVPRGRVLGIDTRAAAAVPGVRVILTPESFPAVPGRLSTASGEELDGRTAIAADVGFYGAEIAAVAAETEAAAEEAARALVVRYEIHPAAIEPEEALAAHAPQLAPEGNAGREILARGDVAAGEAAAVRILEREYSTEAQHHNPLEPHCCVASWEGDELVLWDSNQGVEGVRHGLARALRLPAASVRVLTGPVGGGFGCKNGLKPLHGIAAVLARRSGRPVRLAMSRRDEFVASHQRAKTRWRLRAGVSADARLLSLDVRVVGQAGPSPRTALAAAGCDAGAALYRCPHFRAEVVRVLTNTQAPISFRGPASAEEHFCLEQLVDEIAAELGVDPLEFRRRNAADVHQGLELGAGDELAGARDVPYSSGGLEACYTAGARAFGWRHRPPGSVGDGPRRRGIGVGSVLYHGQLAEPSSVRVELERDGTARVDVGLSEFGCGSDTVLAQIAAEELGLPAERVRVHLGDSRLPPAIDSSYGSRTVSVVGPPVRRAARDVRRQLLELGAAELGVEVERLRLVDGEIVAGEGAAARRLPVERLAGGRGRETIVGPGRSEPPADPRRGVPRTFGAHFVEVEVDVETGQVRVLRAVCAHDAGRWINPLLGASQVHGGFLQGMGMALYEERVMDTRLGAMLNDSMLSYFVPTILDTPEEILPLAVPVVESANSLGVKGLGEPPLVGAGGAIANAVFNAIGVRVRSYPITPDKVLAALGARNAPAAPA